MLNKEEKTILTQSSINLSLLGYLTIQLKENPEMSLNQFYTQFMDFINLPQTKRPYVIFNQGVILTHLYGLLIYPKEKFFTLIPNTPLTNQLIKEWGDFNITKLGKYKTIYDFTIRMIVIKLRNALSHANINILEDLTFQFTDKDGTEIEFDIKGLQKFTLTLNELIRKSD